MSVVIYTKRNNSKDTMEYYITHGGIIKVFNEAGLFIRDGLSTDVEVLMGGYASEVVDLLSIIECSTDTKIALVYDKYIEEYPMNNKQKQYIKDNIFSFGEYEKTYLLRGKTVRNVKYTQLLYVYRQGSLNKEIIQNCIQKYLFF